MISGCYCLKQSDDLLNSWKNHYPLQKIIAAQPLASHVRLKVRGGSIRPIPLPDGSPGPPSHQHTDDTTLHLASRSDLQIALGTSLQPFCAASGSRLNASKSKGMILGSADDFTGSNPETGVFFLPKGEIVKHLGVGLSSVPVSAARDTETLLRLQRCRSSRL